MSTLEPSTRVRLACEMCRKRKRKCDGVQPRCFGCLNRNLECHYESKRPPRQKRDQDYVSGLEGQIGLLKEEVRRLESLNARNAPLRLEDLSSAESAIGDDNLHHETQIGS